MSNWTDRENQENISNSFSVANEESDHKPAVEAPMSETRWSETEPELDDKLTNIWKELRLCKDIISNLQKELWK